jgi:hypothetical protein
MRRMYEVSVRYSCGMGALGIFRGRCKNKTELRLKEIYQDDTDQWRALVNTVMNLRVP